MSESSPAQTLPRLSRRAFLRLALLTGIGAGIWVIDRRTQPVGLATWLGWLIQGWRRRYLGPSSTVAVVACPDYDQQLLARLEEGWDWADGPDVQGRSVLIKPNLVDHIAGRPVTTDARLIRTLVLLLRRRGARQVTVADASAFRKDPLPILDGSGLASVLAELNVPFVDLNHDDTLRQPLRGRFMRRAQHLFLPRTLIESDLVISVPKMKTHHWTDVSLSLKNMFGTVPGVKYGWPKNILHQNGIPASIAALYASFPFDFAIVDGIVGMEGDGPLFGDPVPSGVLVMGCDGVAVDATSARLMGFDPAHIQHLDFMAWAGLGLSDTARLDLHGANLSDLRRNYVAPPKFETRRGPDHGVAGVMSYGSRENETAVANLPN
jgi:uncharacterized protein (DUF362 family)